MRAWVGTAATVGFVTGVGGLAALLLGGMAGPVHRFGLALAIGGFGIFLIGVLGSLVVSLVARRREPSSGDGEG